MSPPSCTASQPPTDRMKKTRHELNEVMNIMRDNIEKMSVRSDHLENLACRAEVLDMTAAEFHKCAKDVRIKQGWKVNSYKYLAATIVVVCILSVVGVIFM